MNHFQNHNDLTILTQLIWSKISPHNNYPEVNDIVLEMIRASSVDLCLRPTHHCATKLYQIHDPIFPTYNANQIPNTTLAAAEGPSDLNFDHDYTPGWVARFFENTLFNQNFPVQTILAIGEPGSKQYRGDFSPYFEPGTQRFETFGQGFYQVNSYSKDSGKQLFEIEVQNPSQTRRTAEVIWIKTGDWQPLPTHQQALDSMAYIYERSKTQYVVIHCAAGVGRTGSALLTFLLLQNYASIFDTKILEEAAFKIQQLLTTLRQTRPGFITTQEQLQSAIKCAIDIYTRSN